MSECHSSNHPVSIAIVVVIINFLTLFTSLKLLHKFASNFHGMFLGWTLTKIVNIGKIPNFYGIMGNFVQFLANS